MMTAIPTGAKPSQAAPHLFERLEEIGARDRYHDIYVVDDEERLIYHLVREICQVVRDEQ